MATRDQGYHSGQQLWTPCGRRYQGEGPARRDTLWRACLHGNSRRPASRPCLCRGGRHRGGGVLGVHGWTRRPDTRFLSSAYTPGLCRNLRLYLGAIQSEQAPTSRGNRIVLNIDSTTGLIKRFMGASHSSVGPVSCQVWTGLQTCAFGLWTWGCGCVGSQGAGGFAQVT